MSFALPLQDTDWTTFGPAGGKPISLPVRLFLRPFRLPPFFSWLPEAPAWTFHLVPDGGGDGDGPRSCSDVRMEWTGLFLQGVDLEKVQRSVSPWGLEEAKKKNPCHLPCSWLKRSPLFCDLTPLSPPSFLWWMYRYRLP